MGTLAELVRATPAGQPLAAIAAASSLVGLVLLWTTLRRLRRRGASLLGILRILVALVALLVAAGAAVLLAALSAYENLTEHRPVAEVRCRKVGPQQLTLSLTPLSTDGSRGPTERYELDGDQWTVGGEVLRFRPSLATLGLKTVYRLSRVEGRFDDAEAARTRRPTVFDREPPSRSWRLLFRHAARGPLGWAIAGAHGQAVSQLPDDTATFVIERTAEGLVVARR